MVQQFRSEILQPFGSIRKGLLETISPDEYMTNHLPFIGLKRAFRLRIQSCRQGSGIRLSFGDSIPEELENVIFLQPFKSVVDTIPMMNDAIPAMDDAIPASGAILYLPESTAIEPTEADHRRKSYRKSLPQALYGVK